MNMSDKSALACPGCGAKIVADDAFCQSCGTKLEPVSSAPVVGSIVMPTCPSCGADTDATSKFCISCGAKLKPVDIAAPRPEPKVPVAGIPAQSPFSAPLLQTEPPAVVPWPETSAATLSDAEPVAVGDSQDMGQDVVAAFEQPEDFEWAGADQGSFSEDDLVSTTGVGQANDSLLPSLPSSGYICSACGAELKPGKKFCVACGTRVEDSFSTSASTPDSTPDITPQHTSAESQPLPPTGSAVVLTRHMYKNFIPRADKAVDNEFKLLSRSLLTVGSSEGDFTDAAIGSLSRSRVVSDKLPDWNPLPPGATTVVTRQKKQSKRKGTGNAR
jgi:uncharacterized OB-fold protein